MENNLKKTLALVDHTYGVSGDEAEVAVAFATVMEGLYDEKFEDRLGNQFYVKKGKNPEKKIVLCAHMDEIGFIVSKITDNGLVKILPVGYHDDRVCVNQRMVILTETGHVTGVTGSIPFHALDHSEAPKPTKIQDLVLDIGVLSKAEALEMGVQLGDYVAFEAKGEFLNNGKFYSSKSVDNRSGLAILVETFRAIQNMDLEASVYAVGTVQEEVGMRAGGPVANRVQPDLLFAIDVCLANGIPGLEDSIDVEMGKGPAVKYYDWDGELGMAGNNVSKKVTRLLCTTAANNHIPFQREVTTGGGTDAWTASLAGTGYVCGGISIPSRYIHTAVGTVHLDDLVNTVKLIVAVLKDFK